MEEARSSIESAEEFERLPICAECHEECEGNLTYCRSCFDARVKSNGHNWRRRSRLESALEIEQFKLEKATRNLGLLEDALEIYRSMLLNSVYSDVTIETGDGDKTPAHRAILASRSPVFRAMFEHELQEKTCAVIHVADICTPVMRALLLYIYTGNQDNNVIKQHGMELLAAAHKYDIPNLKRICEAAIVNQVEPHNALEMLQAAKLYGANKIKEACVKCIARNVKKIAFTDEMRSLINSNDHPEAILEIIQNIADEI